MKYISLLLSLTCLLHPGLSAADWLCREAASQRSGDIINACGVAEAATESEARAASRKAAFEELNSICSQSADCNNYEWAINPLRMECQKIANGYKCYRGIEATITDVPRDLKKLRRSDDERLIPVKKTILQDDLLAGKIERAVVKFSSEPSGGNVYIDGIEICQTPCSREVQLGKHEITIEKLNHQNFQQEITVTKTSGDVKVQLLSLFGYLDLSEIPENAIIKVDDLQVERSKINLQPGKHILTIEHPNYQPFSREIEIKRGVTSKVHNVLDPLFGFLSISASDKGGNALKARIYIDGVSTNEVSPAKLKVASGKRKIELMTDSKLYAAATRDILPDTVYNLNFILGDGKTTTPSPVRSRNGGLLEKLFEKPKECNSQDDCESGLQCATIKGEYPGTCVKRGIGF